jgi:hypothetical protein
VNLKFYGWAPPYFSLFITNYLSPFSTNDTEYSFTTYDKFGFTISNELNTRLRDIYPKAFEAQILQSNYPLGPTKSATLHFSSEVSCNDCFIALSSVLLKEATC